MEAHGTVIVKADTLLGKAVSGEDGKAVFTQDLPLESIISKNWQHRMAMYLLMKFWK